MKGKLLELEKQNSKLWKDRMATTGGSLAKSRRYKAMPGWVLFCPS